MKALAEFISRCSKRIDPLLRAFIRQHKHEIKRPGRKRKTRRIMLCHQGRFFNLLELYQRINIIYFEDKVNCLITWGTSRKRGHQKSVGLGSYSPHTRVIRINPILDRHFVPQYVIDNIIHHEMLHHILGGKKTRGRTCYHHDLFKRLEDAFTHKNQAARWVEANLSRLVRM